MADYEDIKVKDLVINNMSQEKFDELKAAGELQPDQIYFTPESDGASLPDQTDNAGKFLTTDGTTASWSDKPLVNNTELYESFAVGGTVTSTRAISIGYNTSAHDLGAVSIGQKTEAKGISSTAIGNNVATNALCAIQLGATGGSRVTNSDANTFKVATNKGNFEIMSADGTIPAERMSAVAGTTGQVLTKTDAGMEWQDATGGELPDNVLVNQSGTIYSIAVGAGTVSAINNSVAIGFNATSANGVALGSGCSTSSTGVAAGSNCKVSSRSGGLALGYQAIANGEASAQICLRQGFGYTNNDANTVKISNANGNFEMMDANGNVPRERLKNLVEVLPTADNGYTTVKNYGNGYVEITGYASIGTVGAGTGSEVQIDLPAGYTMADTNYWVNIAPTSETTMFDFKAEAKARSTTHFMVAYKNEDEATGLTAAGVYWEVRGMLATA